MCDLLNRIWSRPRGEWTRVLRKEIPAIADRMVESLRQGVPAVSTRLRELDPADMRWAVEQALLTALGYQRRGDDRSPDRADREPGAAGTTAEDTAPVVSAVPLDRARRGLFTVLVGGEASPARLAELSRTARWPLPETVRAVVLASPCEAPQLAAALGNVLAGPVEGELCILVPDPDEETGAALQGLTVEHTAAVGHVVPLEEAASSVRWARRLLAMTPPGGSPGRRVVAVDECLSTLLLLQDESLTEALSARWLGPLAELTPRQSERVEATLLAWLEGGGAPEAARALRVHPQTVRYRLRQIEKLFGPALHDSHTRFELEMALRSRRLLAEHRRQAARGGRRPRAPAAGLAPASREARVNGL